MKKEEYRREREISIDYNNSKPDLHIPACVFNNKLSSYETVVKFLRENHGYSFEKAGRVLGKQKSSTHRAYKKAIIKHKESLEITDLQFLIPLNIFKQTKLPVLEALVTFLKDSHELNYSQISALLMRNESTVRTAYNRAKVKDEA